MLRKVSLVRTIKQTPKLPSHKLTYSRKNHLINYTINNNQRNWYSTQPQSQQPSSSVQASLNQSGPQSHFRHKQQLREKEIVQQSQNQPNYNMPHPIWKTDETHAVKVTHVDPPQFVDKYAYWSVWLLRLIFDVGSGYYFGKMGEKQWLRRIIFLETLAGVPGMMGAMARHLQSLRTMKRDHGWIHTLLEEAENERMHLLVALELRQPGILIRLMVLLAQGGFVNLFFLSYLISPRYCHRFVGYLEEEAVKTYTHLLKDISSGNMTHWKTKKAPEIARNYWRLPDTASMEDVIFAIRADESHHRDVNHVFSEMKPTESNPFAPGH